MQSIILFFLGSSLRLHLAESNISCSQEVIKGILFICYLRQKPLNNSEWDRFHDNYLKKYSGINFVEVLSSDKFDDTRNLLIVWFIYTKRVLERELTNEQKSVQLNSAFSMLTSIYAKKTKS